MEPDFTDASGSLLRTKLNLWQSNSRAADEEEEIYMMQNLSPAIKTTDRTQLLDLVKNKRSHWFNTETFGNQITSHICKYLISGLSYMQNNMNKFFAWLWTPAHWNTKKNVFKQGSLLILCHAWSADNFTSFLFQGLSAKTLVFSSQTITWIEVTCLNWANFF